MGEAGQRGRNQERLGILLQSSRRNWRGPQRASSKPCSRIPQAQEGENHEAEAPRDAHGATGAIHQIDEKEEGPKRMGENAEAGALDFLFDESDVEPAAGTLREWPGK